MRFHLLPTVRAMQTGSALTRVQVLGQGDFGGSSPLSLAITTSSLFRTHPHKLLQVPKGTLRKEHPGPSHAIAGQ